MTEKNLTKNGGRRFKKNYQNDTKRVWNICFLVNTESTRIVWNGGFMPNS